MGSEEKATEHAGEGHSVKLEEVVEVLRQVSSKIDRMNETLEKILRLLTEKGDAELKPLDAMTLVSLPDHLRQTVMVMLRVGEATAGEVAEKTGRARAVESGYLNQLVRMGLLGKGRRGRMVYFSAAQNPVRLKKDFDAD